MEIKLQWSQLAQKDYWRNISYFDGAQSEKEAVNFIQTMQITLSLLQANKISSIRKYENGVHKIAVSNRISLYYKVDSDTISLLRLLNTHLI